MHLAVGEVWVVHRRDMPDTYWHFQIVAETQWEGQPYYIALKCDVPPDSLQIVLFDRQGKEVTPLDDSFLCTRRSRSKHARAV